MRSSTPEILSVRHGRTQGNRAHRQPVHFGFQRVDAVVRLNDLLRQFLIMRHQRADRVCNADFRQTAHFRDQPAQLANLSIEGFYRMLSHVCSPQPYRPVM